MSWKTILSFCAMTMAVGSLPGPSVCFTIGYSIRYGALRTLPTILGQLSANTVFIVLVFFGVNGVLESSPTAFFVLKAAGACYLVYLGIRQWISARRRIDVEAESRFDSRSRSYAAGMIVAGTNPKLFLYYAAFFTQFIDSSGDLARQFFVLGILSILLGAVTLLAYTLLADMARRLIFRNRYTALQNRITGTLMIMAGILLAFLKR